jgi:hypothetical protein
METSTLSKTPAKKKEKKKNAPGKKAPFDLPHL